MPVTAGIGLLYASAVVERSLIHPQSNGFSRTADNHAVRA